MTNIDFSCRDESKSETGPAAVPPDVPTSHDEDPARVDSRDEVARHDDWAFGDLDAEEEAPGYGHGV